MTQYVPLGILGHRYAEPQSNSPIGDSGLSTGIAFHRHTLDEGNSAAVQNPVFDVLELVVECR